MTKEMNPLETESVRGVIEIEGKKFKVDEEFVDLNEVVHSLGGLGQTQYVNFALTGTAAYKGRGFGDGIRYKDDGNGYCFRVHKDDIGVFIKRLRKAQEEANREQKIEIFKFLKIDSLKIHWKLEIDNWKFLANKKARSGFFVG